MTSTHTRTTRSATEWSSASATGAGAAAAGAFAGLSGAQLTFEDFNEAAFGASTGSGALAFRAFKTAGLTLLANFSITRRKVGLTDPPMLCSIDIDIIKFTTVRSHRDNHPQ